MARQSDLQALDNKIYSGLKRRPSVQVLLFDKTDKLSDIVLRRFTQVPFDISEFVTSLTITENLESASECSFNLVTDDLDVLNPYHFVGNKVIQVIYRDLQSEQEFILFTGITRGQPGFTRNRSGQEQAISVKCVDRNFFHNRKDLDTPEYNQGEDFGDILVDIATDSSYGMGLDREECRFGLLRTTVQHTIISLKGVKQIEGMDFIGFIVDKKADFDSEGFLVLRDLSLDKQPIRILSDEDLIISLVWPETEVNLFNKVLIVGLDNNLSKVVSPTQELVEINGTTGFFESEFKQKVFFSEDRQGRAENPFVSEFNINGQLGKFLGGGVSLKKITDFSCVVVIKNPYQPYIFGAFLTGYVGFFILSAFDVFGLGDSFLVAAAIWLTAGLAIMQQLGSFNVTVSGTPFKFVYKEIEGCASWDNLDEEERRELRIENHLVHSQELADSIAFRELKKETIKGNVRNISIPHDPVLEKADIIELPDGTRYFINSITRTFNNRSDNVNMELSCWAIRGGKEFNNQEGFSLY